MNPRKQRFYIAAAGVLAVIALLWSVIGSPVVLWHNHQLKTALTGLTDTSITGRSLYLCAVYFRGRNTGSYRRHQL